MMRIKGTSGRESEEFDKKTAGQGTKKQRSAKRHNVKPGENPKKIDQAKSVEKERNADNAKDAGKGDSTETEDVVRVRESISILVRESAAKIATEIIKVAVTGQLAPAKYLFEAI